MFIQMAKDWIVNMDKVESINRGVSNQGSVDCKWWIKFTVNGQPGNVFFDSEKKRDDYWLELMRKSGVLDWNDK